EDVNEEMDNSLERAATTTTGLDVEQDRGNINKTRSKATLNEPSSSGTSLGSSPRGNTLRSSEDRLKLEELMELRTTLQSIVLALETTKTTQATEIASLKKRVKKLKRRNKLRTYGLKRLYRVGSSRTLTTTTVATTIIAVSTRPKAKGLVIHKQEQAPIPTVSSQPPSRVKVLDKVKGKMVKPEPVKKMSKKELLGRNRVGGGEFQEGRSRDST
ncbi:hypothetical protein Tco_0524999, partial [Tanacetum coccineum]